MAKESPSNPNELASEGGPRGYFRQRKQFETASGLPDERLEDGRGGPFLELQLFVVQCFGICPALGSPLAQQNNAVVISQRQGALEESRTPQHKNTADGTNEEAWRASLPPRTRIRLFLDIP